MKQIFNKYIYSKIGEWHKKNNKENQDTVYSFENDDIVFCAVADGVSSCKNSKVGAELACEAAGKLCRQEYKYFFAIEKDTAKWLIVSYIQKQILKYAERNKQKPEDYASTLCFVCIDKHSKQMMTFTLGDSRIYFIRDKEAIPCVGSAQYCEDNRTYVTMTKNADYEAAITFEDFTSCDSVLLCTDGVWRNFSNQFLKIMDCDLLAEYLDAHNISDDCTFLYVA